MIAIQRHAVATPIISFDAPKSSRNQFKKFIILPWQKPQNQQMVKNEPNFTDKNTLMHSNGLLPSFVSLYLNFTKNNPNRKPIIIKPVKR